MKSARYFCLIFSTYVFSRRISVQVPNIKRRENTSSGSQADRQMSWSRKALCAIIRTRQRNTAHPFQCCLTQLEWNAFRHSVQNLLSSSFIHKNISNKIRKTISLLVVMHECETWSWGGWQYSRIGYRGGHLGISRTKWQGSGEDYITRSFVICTHNPLLFGG